VSQTAAFRQIIRDFMCPSPVLVPVGTPCVEAVKRMTAAAVESILVMGPDHSIAGIVTEQDVSRRIAFRLTEAMSVEAVMTSPVHTIRDQDYLYHAIAIMRRLGLRHMPVVDAVGQVVGVVHLHDALAGVSLPLMRLIDRLTHADTIEGLTHVKAAQIEAAETLLADHVPAAEIQSLLSDINSDLYKRVINLSLQDMGEHGWGSPPVPFAAIVMGSCGRGESHLCSDQDNGFIVADYPDADHGRIDPYFLELATRMTHTLDTVGMPLCTGNVMATNPLWRKTLSQWCEQTARWVHARSDAAVQHADIFFDFVPVFGDVKLAQHLRQHVSELLHQQPAFLRYMCRLDTDHRVALGMFGRLVPEPRGQQRGKHLNLKYHGLLPLIEAIRMLALWQDIPETSTLKRMNQLHTRGVLDASEYEALTSAFELLTSLLLRHQIADFLAHREMSHTVPLAAISKHQKRMLVDAFRAISAFRQRVEFALAGILW
jgi:signal-transduction protein with cAMP-binding, CBS, and nucleotidyltransferase domain